MGYNFAYDGPPSRCYGKARPGIIALRDGVRKRFGCGDMGTYVCRGNTGAAGLSMHADGRAWDAAARGELNRRIFDFFVKNAETLGVQAVIGTPRRKWNSRTRQIGHYGGPHPHDDHVHVELCIAAANTLTLATVLAVGAPPASEEDDMLVILAPGAASLLHAGKLVHIETTAAIPKGIPQWDLTKHPDTWTNVTKAFGNPIS